MHYNFGCPEHIWLAESSSSNGCDPLLKKVDDLCSTLYSMSVLFLYSLVTYTETAAP